MLIYCICTQYLVGASFALITASIRRGMCNPPGSAPTHRAGRGTRDSGAGGGRSTKEAKGYSL